MPEVMEFYRMAGDVALRVVVSDMQKAMTSSAQLWAAKIAGEAALRKWTSSSPGPKSSADYFERKAASSSGVPLGNASFKKSRKADTRALNRRREG
jgi:hypothetical protein